MVSEVSHNATPEFREKKHGYEQHFIADNAVKGEQ